MADRQTDRTSHGNQNVAVRFLKNWAALWGNLIRQIAPPVGGLVAISLGGTLLIIYGLLPMIGYQMYFYGIESFTNEEVLTDWDWAVVLALEIVWVALSVTVPLAAYKTLYGDSDE